MRSEVTEKASPGQRHADEVPATGTVARLPVLMSSKATLAIIVSSINNKQNQRRSSRVVSLQKPPCKNLNTMVISGT